MSNNGTRNCLMAMTDRIDVEVRGTAINLDTVDRGKATDLDTRLDTVDQGKATDLDFHPDTADQGKATDLDSHPDKADQGKVTDLDFHPDKVDLADHPDNSRVTKHQHHHRRIWRHHIQVPSSSQ